LDISSSTHQSPTRIISQFTSDHNSKKVKTTDAVIIVAGVANSVVVVAVVVDVAAVVALMLFVAVVVDVAVVAAVVALMLLLSLPSLLLLPILPKFILFGHQLLFMTSNVSHT
jgi:hypothetical protein